MKGRETRPTLKTNQTTPAVIARQRKFHFAPFFRGTAYPKTGD